MKHLFRVSALPVVLTATALTALVVLFLLSLFPATVRAQTAAANPASITVAGTLGDPPQQRVVFISATTAISGANLLISDFVRADNAATISGLVSVAPPPQRVEAGKPLTLTVTIDFRNARSGGYNGTIWLNYDADGIPAALQIPVAVTIKDAPWPPFFALLGGVAIAALISIYLGGGRQRDDLAVQLERLAARVTATPDLPDPVRRMLRQQLSLAAARLQTGKVVEARAQYDQADELLTRWIGWLESWRALSVQFARARAMLQPDPQGSPVYATEIQRLLREIEEGAPEATSLNEMQDKLNAVIAQINDFLQLDTRHRNLQKILDATTLSADAKRVHQAQIDQLARRLATLLPEPRDNRPAFDELSREIGDLNATLKAYLAQGAPESALLGTSRQPAARAAMVVEDVAPQHAGAAVVAATRAEEPASQPATGAKTAFPWARIRINGFRLAQFLILITLWGWTGYNELYVQNPTFGSDWLSNYFTLIAWGFTSEAARTTFTSLAGRIGIAIDQTP